MDKLELQKLRELPIEGVAERLGLQVTHHKALCPFHDDHHASLSFSVRRNTFRCFVCNAKGGTIDLVMQYLNLGFKEACRWLNDECGMRNYECGIGAKPSSASRHSEFRTPNSEFPTPNSELTSSNASHFRIPNSEFPTPNSESRTPNSEFNPSRYARYFDHPWLSPEACKFLFERRLLHPAVVRYCRLNSFRDWLQIPYYSREGRLVGIQQRYMGTDPAQPRFRFPQGSDCGIYNLPVLNRLRPDEALFITEGCSDCWAMLSAGHKAVAIPSATLLKPRDMELLSSLHDQLSTEFHMFPDRDVPGERLFLQLKEVLPNLIHHQLPLGCKDYSEYYIKSRRETRDCETRDCELVTCPEVSCHVSHSTHHHHGN